MRFKDLSLRVKFTAVALSVGLLSILVSIVISYKLIAHESRENLLDKALLIKAKVMDDFKAAMVFKDHAWLQVAMYQLMEFPSVRELRVFGVKGNELFPGSSKGTERLALEAIGAGRSRGFEKQIGEEKVSTFIFPLENEKLCRICHSEGNRFQGALLFSLSLQDVENDIVLQGWLYSLLFGLTAIVVTFGSIFAVNALFLSPLKRIREGTEAIDRGDFQHRIPVSSFDEIGRLSEEFNKMSMDLDSFRKEQERYMKELQVKRTALEEQFELLSLSEKEWIETFDSIKDLIAILDDGMTITRANRAFREYFPLEEVIGRKCHDLLGACLHPEFQCPHETAIDAGSHETRELYDEDKGRVLQISFFPFHTAGGRAGSIIVAKDITEMKENEMRMMMTERFALLGQMSSGIAHEINNPLATIKTCAEGLANRLKRGDSSPELMEKYLKIIDEEVSRCKAITDSMLGFVRPGSRKDIVDINSILDMTLELVRFQGRLKNVEIEKKYSGGTALFAGEGELKQAFLPVIVNALDAMEDRGRLTIETWTQEKRIFVKIQDTGPAIPPEIIARIFEPFYTTRPEKEGSGPGLSITKKIITALRGEIGVQSEKGIGTVFTLSFPLS
ncbi:MAG: ATP-binding protein [Thermodesulfovibrionales bacterium]|jgi:PAS domain S-box-containing protein